VLGRLDPDYFLGGEITLDRDAASGALGRLGAQLGLSAAQAALAVVSIANEEMVNAIRVRTVEVGVDPRRYSLVAFGGAGPLHATAIARRLGIAQVVIPARPGLGSALGALTADLRSDQVATVHARSDSDCADQLQARANLLRSSALAEIDSADNGATVTTRLALRYAGQNYEHDVQLPPSPITGPVLDEAFSRFGELHREFYGYDLRGEVIEIVDLTVTASVPSRIELPPPDAPARRSATRRDLHFAAGSRDATVVHREAIAPGTRLAGPAIVQHTNATTLIEEHDSLVALEDGSLMIYVETGGPER
jgi:N-methylhydantoinase A/oxoprolinase/acetone carboxylase beta subunit